MAVIRAVVAIRAAKTGTDSTPKLRPTLEPDLLAADDRVRAVIVALAGPTEGPIPRLRSPAAQRFDEPPTSPRTHSPRANPARAASARADATGASGRYARAFSSGSPSSPSTLGVAVISMTADNTQRTQRRHKCTAHKNLARSAPPISQHRTHLPARLEGPTRHTRPNERSPSPLKPTF